MKPLYPAWMTRLLAEYADRYAADLTRELHLSACFSGDGSLRLKLTDDRQEVADGAG